MVAVDLVRHRPSLESGADKVKGLPAVTPVQGETKAKGLPSVNPVRGRQSQRATAVTPVFRRQSQRDTGRHSGPGGDKVSGLPAVTSVRGETKSAGYRPSLRSGGRQNQRAGQKLAPAEIESNPSAHVLCYGV